MMLMTSGGEMSVEDERGDVDDVYMEQDSTRTSGQEMQSIGYG